MNAITYNLNMAFLLDGIEEAIIVIDVNGHVLLFNDAAEHIQLLKIRPIQSGAILFDLIPPARRDLIKAVVRDVIQYRKILYTNAEHVDLKGKTFHFEMRYSPMVGDDFVNHVFIEIRDVTQQKISENKITTVASELSSLIENANAVIIGIDTQGYITEWNEMSSRLTGYAKNEALTKTISDLLIERSHRLNFSLAMEEVLSGKLMINYELPVMSSDRRKLIFLISATPRNNVSGKAVGILLVGQDITELSEYRKTLERKVDERTRALQVSIQKEKELVEIRNRFVAVASHEFKSPLSSIDYDIAWMKTNLEKLTPEETTGKLDHMQTSVRHMMVMLEDLLVIGKSEAGKLRANEVKVELTTFFKKIIREVEINNKNTHTVILDAPPEPIEIESDEKLMRNVFINLLTNAMKFSPNQNEVYVTITPKGKSVEIRIKDMGIGIDEKDLQTIFEPFSRGRNADEIRGTGLGLSIVKRAIDALDGKMTVETQIGLGTEFCITLSVKDHSNNGQSTE